MNAKNSNCDQPTNIFPAGRVVNQSVYRVPAFDTPIKLRLDRNEGNVAFDEFENERILNNQELARRYPSVQSLEKLLAERFGVANDQVLVTAGGDDGLLRVCLAMLEPGRQFILPVPTFEMLARYTWLAGGEPVEIPWLRSRFPVDEILARINSNTSLIAVVSPNNPTGSVASPDDLRTLSEAAPHTLLLVDLAYTEFADIDLTDVVLSLPNALFVRTFSKAWGMAGLRVGYVVGPKSIIDWLRCTGNPYAVSALSAALVADRFTRSKFDMLAYVNRVHVERQGLFDYLTSKKIAAISSQANFVFAQTPHAESIWRGLAELGIAVRWFGGQPNLSDALRITCPGDEASFALLLQALEKVLEQHA